MPFPVELVFSLFANPSNLPHLMPPQLKTRIEDARLQPPPARPVAPDPARRFRSVAAGVGSEILVSFYPIRWVPRRVSWMVCIAEFVWNSHFCDEQIRGPFAQFRHCHSIQAEVRDGVEGTLVSDDIEYVMPFGSIGGIASGFVRRQLDQSFAYRHERLPEILALASRQAVQRG